MNKKEVKISAKFKSQTTKAIGVIVLFIITYVIMLVFAVLLTAISVYGGIALIALRPTFITIALGIGLASLGILVLFFLVKFIFKSHKVDRSHLIEITKKDEPQLFNLIDKIVKEVGTNFPKKVYLSSDVNASVFYDSSFWSMFFPVKKNLQIGLGLVNTVSKSELIAILSHEFGHFSQKTMKVGSYVYNVNQVIFNLVSDDDSYNNFIEKFGNSSGYFTIFVVIAVKIIEAIKLVLKQMYSLVNKSYMGLSREMEFHADEIAATVTGYEPLQNSLLRMSIADNAFSSVLAYYENKISENKTAENVFRDQLFVTNFLARENKIKINDQFPEVTLNDLNKFNKSKLVVKDQWASHPSTEDRIARLQATGLQSDEIDNSPANSIFTDIEKTQQQLTNHLFKTVVYESSPSAIPFETFQKNYEMNFVQNTFPELYKGYYDNKNPMYFDVNLIAKNSNVIELQDLFSEEKIDLVYSSLALHSDIESIKQIAGKDVDVRTFDYDGIKYKKNDCKKLAEKLELQLIDLNEQIKLNDIAIFQFFESIEKKIKPEPTLLNKYAAFFEFDKKFDAKYDVYTKLSEALQFVNYTTPMDQIRANFRAILAVELALKEEIKLLIDHESYQELITTEMKENFEKYLSENLQYFGNEIYFDKNLEILFGAVENYAFLLSRSYFLMKKDLLQYQIELLESSEKD